MRNKIFTVMLSLLIVSVPAHGFLGDGGSGWAQIPYLAKVLAENLKRYKQLKTMLERAKKSDNYFRAIHEGLEDITGLSKSLAVSDHGVLADLEDFNKTLEIVTEVYGKIPESPEAVLHSLHDRTAAESLQMVNSFKSYSEVQEENSQTLKTQSQTASPKGAARATAVSNAMILESVNQLIRLQSQSLKLQSEQLAMLNKQDKQKVIAYQEVNKDLSNAFKSIKRQENLVRF